ATSRRSMMSVVDCPAWSRTAFSSSGLYLSFWTALRISDGLVVASRGVNAFIVWKSPVSATIVVYCLSCSSWFMAVAVKWCGSVGGFCACDQAVGRIVAQFRTRGAGQFGLDVFGQHL